MTDTVFIIIIIITVETKFTALKLARRWSARPSGGSRLQIKLLGSEDGKKVGNKLLERAAEGRS